MNTEINSNIDSDSVIASRCPECGAIIAERTVNLTQTPGSENIIKCKICGKSSMTIRFCPDGNIRLSVPCLLCAHQHPYTLKSFSFLEKKLFILPCSYSGLDICFIGSEKNVDEALKLSAKQLKQLFEERDNEEVSKNFLNADIMQEVMYAIEELAITNRIACDCGEPNLAIVVDYDKVCVSCKDCGCKKILYAAEKDDVNAALEIKKLRLEKT